MSADRAMYLDSSAIIKLVIREPESTALRAFLPKRRALVTSALAHTEVLRAVLPWGESGASRARSVLDRCELIRIGERVLDDAARMLPGGLRSLDAIHLATALSLGSSVTRVVTYDKRMADAAQAHGLKVAAPA